MPRVLSRYGNPGSSLNSSILWRPSSLAKEEALRFDGIVIEILGNAMFRVKLNDTEHLVTAYVGGKMRKFDIKIIEGDKVTLEMSPYDLSKGRIVYRGK